MTPMMTRCLAAAPALLLAPAAPSHAQAPALPAVIHPSPRPDPGEAVNVARDGHFYLDAVANGARLRMLFDTGATRVVIRAEDAPRLGIDPARLDYRLQTRTANGTGRAAPVILSTLTVGSITRRDVPAIVAHPGQLAENLLGQSFLARLPGYRQNGNQLVLLDRP